MPELALTAVARVRFTTRADGDMGLTSPGDPSAAVRENRRRLVASCGVNGIAIAPQVHAAHVNILTADARGYAVGDATADGQATTLTRTAVAVHVADCLPVAITAGDAVAMLHAGWRGLHSGVLEAGVAALRELGATGPVTAAVGPGAGVCCYEAGPEVHAAFAAYGASAGRNVDLRAVAHVKLTALGAVEIADLGGCTICGGEWFSHRRGDAGRQVGVAWLSDA